MSTSLLHVQRAVHILFLSHVFAFTLATRKTKHRTFHFHIAIQIFNKAVTLLPAYHIKICVTGCNSHLLYVPGVHLNYGKQSLCYCGTTIRNSLCTPLTEVKSLNSSKLFVWLSREENVIKWNLKNAGSCRCDHIYQ